MSFYKFLFILIIYASALRTAQGTSFKISSEIRSTSLGSYLRILEDKTGKLTIDDVLLKENDSRFLPSRQAEPGFGFTASVYWVKLTVENPQNKSVNWFLEFTYPLLDYISLYIPDENGKYIVKKTGDRLPFSSRDINHRNFLFSLKEEGLSSRTYVFRIQSGSSMNFPMNFYLKDEFLTKIDTEQLLLGVYFGTVIIMIIYNFFLFLGFKEKSFIYLLAFIALWGFGQMSLNGLAFQYLWPDLTWWANVNIPFFIFASLAAATQFCRSLLKTNEYTPLADKLLVYEILIFLFGMIISLIIDYSLTIRLAAAAAVIDILSLGFISGINLKYGRSALFFLSAWGLFLLGALLFAFKSFGLLPGNFITNWSVQIGNFALMVLFSIAILDRINTERQEKFTAQQESLDYQKKLVESLKESERVLEMKVEERTDELNRINILLIDRATELSNINQIAEKVSSTLNLQDILNYITEELVNIFEVQSAAIGLLNEKKTKLRIAAFHSVNKSDDSLTGTELFLFDYEASIQVMNTRQPLLIKDPQIDQRTKAIHNYLNKSEADSILIIPILSKNEVIGTIGMPFIAPDYEFDKNKLELAKSIAFHIASSVENARLYAKTESALDRAEQDLEIGRQIQSGFFPESLPLIKGWEFAAHFKPAREVAGDFYDIFSLKESKMVVFVIADVCDKGVGAALFMVLFRTLVRSLSEINLEGKYLESEIRNIINTVNNYITRTHGSSNMFASMFYAVLFPETGELFYINAGHEAPLIISSEGNIKNELLPTAPVVGMMPDINYEVSRAKFNRCDILFCYTDGTTDARNFDKELFTDVRLFKTVKAPWPSAFSLLYNLNSELNRFIGTRDQYDDITQIAIRYKDNDEILKHSFTRPAEMEYLEELRGFVEKAALFSGLDKENTFAFKLAAEEICTNIIQHGYNGNYRGDIKLNFILEKDKVTLVISDSGRYFSPWQIESPDLNAGWEEREPGGLGVHFVKELFDKVDYKKAEDNSNQLVLEKKLIHSLQE